VQRIFVNGEPREAIEGVRLAALLADLGLDARAIAVERNGDIVPRATYADVTLGDGDAIEIVHFVGGG